MDLQKYTISVMAELTGVTAYTLRQYERRGLVVLARSPGGTRLYSDADVELIREIARLAGQGINCAGVEEVLRRERLRASS